MRYTPKDQDYAAVVTVNKEEGALFLSLIHI